MKYKIQWSLPHFFNRINECSIVKEEGLTDSNQPICMSPEQAVDAAKLLKTSIVVPIHYGSFQNDPIYVESENLIERLVQSSKNENFTLSILEHMEAIHV